MRIIKTIFFLWLCTTALVHSQTQQGNIFGTVVESSGNGIPGVMVTLTSATAGKLTTVTSETGQYRFLALPPAKDYQLKYELDGFKTQVHKGVRVNIGENATINAMIELGQINESIEVIAVAPIIDIRKTTSASNITNETLQSLPSARDPWVILDKTPGLTLSTANVGGSASGQQSTWNSRGEARANSQWNLDGIDVGDPTSPGASGCYFDFDMFEEMQIQTAANDVTAMTGGVNINFVTKRGQDKLFGGGRFYWTDKSLQGKNLPEGLAVESLSGNTINNIMDYGVNVGGPIIKGKAWFLGSYSAMNIDNVTMLNKSDKVVLTNYNGKLNLNLSSHRLELYGMWGEKTRNNRANNALDRIEASRSQSGPSWMVKLQDDFSIGRDLLTSLKVSYYRSTYDLLPNGGINTPIYEDWDAGWRYNSGTYSAFDSNYKEASLTFNYYTEKLPLGSHDFVLGLNTRMMHANQGGGYANGLRVFVKNALTPTAAAIQSEGVRAYRNWLDNYDYDRYSAYIQDTITTGRLTLNLGLRFDMQKAGFAAMTIPGTNIDLLNSVYDPATKTTINANIPDASRPAADFPASFKFLSPRLGFVYDITGKGKTVVKGNFSIYGGMMNFHSSTGLAVPFELATTNYFNWNDIDKDQVVDASELQLSRIVDNSASVIGAASKLIDPNLTPDKDMEFLLGLEHELIPMLSVSVNYIHRKIYNLYWNAPYVKGSDGVERLIQTSDWSQYTFTQDGKEYTYWDTKAAGVSRTNTRQAQNIQDYHVIYNGVDIIFKKAMADKWMLMGSISLQSSKQHYASALGYSNFDPTNHVPVEMLEGTDAGAYNSRWMVKLNGLYQLPWGINFGAGYLVREGYVFRPVYELKTSKRKFDAATPKIDLAPVGDSRYGTYQMLDLRLEKMFQIGNLGRLFVSLDGFNVLNSDYVLTKQASMSSARFDLPTSILNPRVFRLGLRFDF